MNEDRCPVQLTEEDSWKPSELELERIEELGFFGICEPREMCSILGVSPKQLAYASLFGEALSRHQRGQAKAHLSLNQTLMGMATGTMLADQARFSTTRYILQSRFGYDESRAVTKSRENIEIRKMKFAKKVHRDNLDLQTSRLIGSMSEEDLKKFEK